MKDHKELEVWQRSMDMVVSLYQLTAGFPKEEIYDSLTSILEVFASSLCRSGGAFYMIIRLAFLLYPHHQNHFPPQMTQMATDEEQEMMEFLLHS